MPTMKLVCVHPFHYDAQHFYAVGQEVTDPEEMAKLSEDREHHFVRVSVPDPEPPPPDQPAP